MRLSHISKLLAVGTIIASVPAAAQVTVGTATNGFNCLPFGCNLDLDHYQQVYTSSAFAGPMSIDAITFFHTVNGPGSGILAAGTYDISLGTTASPIDGLSHTFSGNETSPLELFAELVIPPGASGAATTFTIPGTAFLYDPAVGNLLLDVQYTSSASPFNTFFDSDETGLVTSRWNGNEDDAIPSRSGLVTRFDGAAVTATPEPATLVLEATGLLGVVGLVRRRRRTQGEAA